MSMKNVTEAMAWRYATKKFDVSKKLSDDQLAMLLEAVRLSPTSFGLPLWKVITVTSPETRAQLQQAAYGQTQVVDASAVLIFATEKIIDEHTVDRYIDLVVQTRGVAVENLAGYAGYIKGAVAGKSPEARKEWAAKQAYIALGVLMTAAASEGIDTCPMEGFDAAKFDEILGLSAKGLESCVMATVGFRSEEDAHAQEKKVRLSKEDCILQVK